MPRIRNNAILLLLLVAVAGSYARSFACVGNCPEGTCGLASVTFDIPRSVISPDTLAILLKSGDVCLIECRTAAQKSALKIPGALVVCDDVVIASMTGQLPAKDRLIIIYKGVEGGDIVEMIGELRKLGYMSILEFQAGIPGWLTYGYKVEGESVP
ncbi:MAG: hypothetical protein GQF41_2703 [Candidatus Rifleibacterium amylolyticum]|nr:MAG: hypothetical protein GQF41_2703 [Candidatus Rifleibacterium amylolyticum]